MYDAMRDTVSWKRRLGDPEIPGVPNLADPVLIPARKAEAIISVSDDLQSNVQFTVLPEHEVTAKDWIDGAEVMKVAVSKDSAGNIRWRTCYAKL